MAFSPLGLNSDLQFVDTPNNQSTPSPTAVCVCVCVCVCVIADPQGLPHRSCFQQRFPGRLHSFKQLTCTVLVTHV
jgi:hypothetical protein